MGVNIYLEIFSDKIKQDNWNKVYDESLKLIKAYPFVFLFTYSYSKAFTNN